MALPKNGKATQANGLSSNNGQNGVLGGMVDDLRDIGGELVGTFGDLTESINDITEGINSMIPSRPRGTSGSTGRAMRNFFTRRR